MRRFIEYFKNSLWFYPSAIVLAAVGLALGLLEIDQNLETEHLEKMWPSVFEIGADGAREMLSTIAGSIITVAGVAFSVTIVVLSLASSQYSPRVLRNFMGDGKSQSVLGGFLGIYAYCLLVLRTIHSAGDAPYIPYIAVSASGLLAFVAIGLLIYFIHHVASSIRASEIIHSVYQETLSAINTLPDNPQSQKSEIKQPEMKTSLPYTVVSENTGYIQSIDTDHLHKASRHHSVNMIIDKRVGDFIIKGQVLLQLSKATEQHLLTKIYKSIRVGSIRTLEQDISFGFRQLVDVALKGLSPGINDTTTAVISIHYLGALLAQLASKNFEFKALDEDSKFKVIVNTRSFNDYVDLSFNQIRQHGLKNPAILEALAQSLESILEFCNDEERRRHVVKHLQLINFILQTAEPRQEFIEVEIKTRKIVQSQEREKRHELDH